jgi:formylglycine-generating enzyme required for sulfatase activity
MKTQAFAPLQSRFGLLAGLLATSIQVPAQLPLELGIQTYAGLTITARVGRVYSIEYATELTAPVGDWRCLEFVPVLTSPFIWVDTSAPAVEKRFYRASPGPFPTNMVFIHPGAFRMGSPWDEEGRWAGEGPVTPVRISRAYWIGKYPVTQGEYLEVMGVNPSRFNEAEYGVDLRRPVERVSWHDAMAYCAALTERESQAGRIPQGVVYRLPTEAEWEYACRAWSSARFSFGDDPGYASLANYGWYADNSGGTTHPVGEKQPNLWGLHDLHGNVFEWCSDWYESLPGRFVVDPQGPATSSIERRVTRGGSWDKEARACRAAVRWSSPPNTMFSDLGFRVVLAPKQ